MIQALDKPFQDKSMSAAPPVEANAEQAKNTPGDLATKAALGNVDHKTFADAQAAHAGDKSSIHLPDVAVPVALDKSVISEREKLVSLAESQLQTPAARQIQADMDKFEQRADSLGLTPAQVSESYKRMEKMLGPAPNSPIPPEQRQALASQWMDRLADPTHSTRQGWHDTCGWTFLEVRLLTKDPDKISDKMAEVITTGRVSTYDWEKGKQMAANGDTSGIVPGRIIALDPDSLKPDQEAQGLSSHADRRDYADQLAQIMLDNINWDAKTRTPRGEIVATGTMHYDQCSVIERPSDPGPDGKSADKSCESVSYNDPKTGQRVVLDGHGYGFGGASTSRDLNLVNSVITGRIEQVVMQRPTKGSSINGSFSVDSVDELNATLSKLQKNAQFPMAATVWFNNPGVIEDYLARHPEKTAAQVPQVAHAIAVTGLDAHGNVEIYNPWGVKRMMTPDELLKSMTKTGVKT